MATRNHLGLLKGAPGAFLAGIRFIPGASPTILEQWGVKSLTRNGAGSYTVALANKPKGMIAKADGQENDTTTFHFTRVESQSDAAGTVTVSHKSVAFASVASGPTASDTVDEITVLIYARGE